MKLVYTHENRLLVNNAQNMLESRRINTLLKNEYAAGAMGDIAPIDSWMELWVLDEKDYQQAIALLNVLLNRLTTDTAREDWLCSQCDEHNDAAFDFCWKCKTNSTIVE
jgi:hypothetical protein